MSEEAVCRVVSRVFEVLVRKVYEAYTSKSVDPKVIKEDLKKLRELAESVSKKSGCSIDLSKIDMLIEEADEDNRELEEVKKSLGK